MRQISGNESTNNDRPGSTQPCKCVVQCDFPEHILRSCHSLPTTSTCSCCRVLCSIQSFEIIILIFSFVSCSSFQAWCGFHWRSALRSDRDSIDDEYLLTSCCFFSKAGKICDMDPSLKQRLRKFRMGTTSGGILSKPFHACFFRPDVTSLLSGVEGKNTASL